MNPCESKSQLTGYLLGELPAHEAAVLNAHLAVCPECRATADELRATLALLRATLAPAEGVESDMRLDDARRQRLLAVRPERANTHPSRWFFATHPAFRAAAAAVVVISLVLYGVKNSMSGCAVGSKAYESTVGRNLYDAPVSATVSDGVGDESRQTRFGLVVDEKLAKRSGKTDWSETDSDARAPQPTATPSPAGPPAKPSSPTRDSVSTVKSPIKMKGVYATRSAGEASAREALPAELSEPKPDIAVQLNEQVEDKEVTAPEGKTRLKIAIPKPQFTGTPKDIRSPNLESARDRLESDTKSVEAASAKEEVKNEESKPAPSAEHRWAFGGGVVAGKRLDAGLIVGQPATSQRVAPPAEKTIAHEIVTANPVVKDAEKAGTDDTGDVTKNLAETPVPVAFNPFVAAAAEPFSTFAMDVDTASYTLTRQAIRSGAMPDPERVRTEEIVNAFDYGDTAPERAVFRVYQDGAQSPFGAGYHLLRIGVKGRRLGREEQRPAMLTFVVDISGSMAQPDRIGLARLALTSLLDQLAERDRIQIIAYSDHARLVLEPVAASEKAQVLAAFERLQCNGSTNLEEGLRQAYEQAARGFVPGAENRVILISDGVANLGAGSAREILDKVSAYRKQGITCSVFGVGAGTYNDRMLEELANKGDGVYRFLDSADEVRTAFVDDLAATLNTIAKDAKIQVEWNPAVVRQYRQLGYENRALRKEQFRDDAVDAGEVGSGQSVTALYELELAPDVVAESRLGTVRVRYQRTDTGKVEEIEAPLVAASVLHPAHAADMHFRVAACAAEFAELLRGSPHAAGGRFQDVADCLRPAALELSLDTRVKELLDLITAAAAIKGR